MTLIYIPQRIETVEQAEALPRKALVFDNETDGWIQPLIKGGRDDGDWFWMGDDEWEPHPDDLVGWTALVPVEAEEEWGVEMSEGGAVTHVVRAVTREHAERTLSHQEPGAARIVHRIRATPWEEA